MNIGLNALRRAATLRLTLHSNVSLHSSRRSTSKNTSKCSFNKSKSVNNVKMLTFSNISSSTSTGIKSSNEPKKTMY